MRLCSISFIILHSLVVLYDAMRRENELKERNSKCNFFWIMTALFPSPSLIHFCVKLPKWLKYIILATSYSYNSGGGEGVHLCSNTMKLVQTFSNSSAIFASSDFLGRHSLMAGLKIPIQFFGH